MKKISYNLHFGIVGSKKSGMESGKEIFTKYLEKIAIEKNLSNINKDNFEFLIVFQQIPIKVRVFLAETLNEIINNYERIKKLDVILLILNLYDFDSIEEYKKQTFEELNEYFQFRGGISILVGLDLVKIFNGFCSKIFRISSDYLIEKAKELKVLYCYEIQNKNSDLSELFNKIFNDFLFKFQLLSPELFDRAKSYGKELMEEKILKDF